MLISRPNAQAIPAVLLCNIVFISTVWAHGLGLESSGYCHNVRKTGGYHCHRDSYHPTTSEERKLSPRNLSNDTRKNKNIAWSSNKWWESSKRYLSGERIVEVQRYLSYFGYDFGSVDGVSGPKTRAAIRAYQRSQNITADGKVTTGLLVYMANVISQRTVEKLISKQYEKLSTASLETERTQFYMNKLELYFGRKDGLMNTELEQAIMRFQHENRMSVDGIASEQLVRILELSL